jgi:raffinose/stachyose/melibiose transport system permease protein
MAALPPHEGSAAPAALPGEVRGRGRLRVGEGLTPWLFVAPLVAIFALFYLWPALNTIASSLFRWGLLAPWKATAPGSWDYVGLQNYGDVLRDSSFWNAAVNTAMWLVIFPILVVGFSFLVSVLIWHARRGSGLFRSVFVLPMTISLTAAGVIWTFVYNADPQVGVLSAIVRALHLDFSFEAGPLRLQTGEWLGDVGVLNLGFTDLRLTNLSLIFAGFWAFAGFGVITFTAGLTSISQDLVEAAQVDGATSWQVVRHVLLPSLRRPMIIVAVVSVIFALRVFDIVYVMTQGGPVQDTNVLALLLWQDAFEFLDTPDAGLAAAIAVLLSVVLVVVAYPYLRRLARGAGAR